MSVLPVAALQKRLEWAAFTEMALHAIGEAPTTLGWPRELADCIVDNGWWLEFGPPKPVRIAELAEVNAWLETLVADPLQRRILRARALAHPVTESYVFSWRDIARLTGISHTAVVKRHGKALRDLSSAISHSCVANKTLDRLALRNAVLV